MWNENIFLSFNLYKIGSFIEDDETFKTKYIIVDSLAYSFLNLKSIQDYFRTILENNESLRISEQASCINLSQA